MPVRAVYHLSISYVRYLLFVISYFYFIVLYQCTYTSVCVVYVRACQL